MEFKVLKQFGEIAIKLSRSPLSIIALSFVFVYGFAALVASIGTFYPDERIILIWFLVLFPVLILCAFYLLVTKHHKKLYSPSDFQNEKHFMAYSDHGTLTLKESTHTTETRRSLMEYKILQTLWTKQVNYFPDYSNLWTFRIGANTPIFLQYREAASKLIGEGIVSETDQGQLYLTKDGFEYCKRHYKEFPPEQWWSDEIINEKKLRIALGNNKPALEQAANSEG